ncbi:UNVERIFIED_CONTAM: hypothetical protein FKN15_060982 [Acipenser sinensis]
MVTCDKKPAALGTRARLVHLVELTVPWEDAVDEAYERKKLRAKKKNKPLNLKIHNSVGSCENIPSQRSPLLSQRSPLLSERSLRSFFVGYPSFLPSTPPVHSDATFSAKQELKRKQADVLHVMLNESLGALPRFAAAGHRNTYTLSVPRWSPQIPRRDLGNSIKHRWLFKENQDSSLHTSFPLSKKSVSSWAKLRTFKNESKESRYSLAHGLEVERHCATASHYYKYKQQFIFPEIKDPFEFPDSFSHFFFPDVTPEVPSRAPQVILHPVNSDSAKHILDNGDIELQSLTSFYRIAYPTVMNLAGCERIWRYEECHAQNEDGNNEAENSEDEFEEMNLSLLSARNFPRKASQTSIFLQEWDIPFEQLEIGELIGKGRFGQVFHGRWHGEIAIRLIDIERDNEDQLKAFKREVMAYRNTRHENVVLFMGACMSPPHLAIITSLCKGRTLYSVVRDAKIVLDVNKTRQIAQEIVKGMGYLHAKGILHKDMKSKNVFYDNGKVVITDFGLFTISGVLQAGRLAGEGPKCGPCLESPCEVQALKMQSIAGSSVLSCL